MNHGVSGNRDLFWKGVSEMNGGKMGSCRRIKDWYWERMKSEGFSRVILRIYMI